MKNKIIQGDCLEVLKTLDDNSVDSIITDPPAGISFMGKSWDTDKGGRDHWIKWMCDVATECKRVLKPGGHAFVWAIPRTSHWTATAWENAGFEIRDIVAHVFGSGFPKSHNIGKSVDKLQGNKRESEIVKGKIFTGSNNNINGEAGEYEVTKGTSQFEGWGSALKPAREDWLLMRKPLDKGLSIAENCLKWGTGGINIDESRVAHNEPIKMMKAQSGGDKIYGQSGRRIDMPELKENGRFPANLLHDNSDEVRECFPETKPTKPHGGDGGKLDTQEMGWGFKRMPCDLSDNGGNASRFFKSIPIEEVKNCIETHKTESKKSVLYFAKASKSERNRGCEGLELKGIGDKGNGLGRVCEFCGVSQLKPEECSCEVKSWINPPKNGNNHPTVKPIALMEYLIKMITPKGGIVLDPFAGSGSTLIAAKQNGFHYIGIELNTDYIKIAEARLQAVPNKLF